MLGRCWKWHMRKLFRPLGKNMCQGQASRAGDKGFKSLAWIHFQLLLSSKHTIVYLWEARLKSPAGTNRQQWETPCPLTADRPAEGTDCNHALPLHSQKPKMVLNALSPCFLTRKSEAWHWSPGRSPETRWDGLFSEWPPGEAEAVSSTPSSSQPSLPPCLYQECRQGLFSCPRNRNTSCLPQAPQGPH